MIRSSSNSERTWTVLLLGGASGCGKTSVSYRLARHFDAGITEVDDFHIVLSRMTTPEQQPIIHYWTTHPEAVHMSGDEITALQIQVAEALSPAIKAVIANHLETNTPIVLEGDYLLPSLAASIEFQGESAVNGEVRAVFIDETDEDQFISNFLAREPDSGPQRKRAQASRLFGQWLADEARRLGIPVVSARPWETVLERVIAALARG